MSPYDGRTMEISRVCHGLHHLVDLSAYSKLHRYAEPLSACLFYSFIHDISSSISRLMEKRHEYLRER